MPVSFGIFLVGTLIGCGFGTLMYLWHIEDGFKVKAAVLIFYALSWVFMKWLPLEVIGHVPLGFLMQVGLCIFYVVRIKMDLMQ